MRISAGEQIKRTDALAANHGRAVEQSADTQKDAEQAADGEKRPFSVAWGINRSPDADERQGFALIAFAAGLGVCLLVLLYVKVIRKQRK